MLVDMGHCEHIPDETFRWGTNYVTCVGDFIGWIKKEASGNFFLQSNLSASARNNIVP